MSIVRLIAAGVIAISACTLIGYAFGSEILASWSIANQNQVMAINTACGLFLVAVALILLSRGR